MARSDPDKLAEALRANLKLRKQRMRAAQDGDAAAAPPPVDSGADEEGDVPPPVDDSNGGVGDGQRFGAWVSVGSKKT